MSLKCVEIRRRRVLCCPALDPSSQLAFLPHRRYLEEVGYTDTILDMRSKRVRSLLGRCSVELNGTVEPSDLGLGPAPGPPGLNGGESLLVKQIEEQIKR